MQTTRRLGAIAIVAMWGMPMLAWTAPAVAQPSRAAITCEAEKLKAAGRYGFCRLGMEAQALKRGTAPNYARCDRQYGAKWNTIEKKAAEQCSVTGDQTTLQDLVSQCTDEVAAAIAGEDFEGCTAEVSACTAEVVACGGELGTCSGGLGTCTTSLDSCTGSLDACNGDLTAAQGALGACTGTLAACEDDRDDTQADLLTCSGDLATCGDERDDAQADLASCSDGLTTCEDELADCSADLGTCPADLAACQAAPQGQLRRTGQTTCYSGSGAVIACAGTGQDAALQKGLAVSFTDNGNGTITDDRSGLTWEKLSDDGSIHDWDDWYLWTPTGTTKIATLNATAFAGFSDWRLPNISELQTLANFGTANPAAHAPFHTGCVAGCTVLTCSCTKPSGYWSSTTNHSTPNGAWYMNYLAGRVVSTNKVTFSYVRAVRGGV